MSISRDELLAELERRERAQQTICEYAKNVVGFVPAPHHRLICDTINDMILNDTFDDLIVNTPPGSAKALALDTPIPTPDGWSMMGDLRAGDVVFDENGQPCYVTWVSPVHRNRPVYSVKTDCGDEIIADRDHEWLVRLCGKQKPPLSGVGRWGNATSIDRSRDPTFKIKETHFLARSRSKRPMVLRAAALDLPEQPLSIDPYLLGVWLGDGSSSSLTITSSDEDRPWLRSEIHRLGYVTTDRAAPCLFGVKGVRHLFVELGLINDPRHKTYGRKHIPAPYLRASREQRLHLLQGLIDTDGTVCRKRGCATFCNTNLELALQVRELVRSLGVKAGWSESRAMLNGVDHGPAYKVSFYLSGSARLPRKAILTRNQYRTPNTYIEVVPVGTADTVCIEVNSPSHLFLCGRSMTPTHNSSYVSHVVPAWYLGRFPSNNIIIASHSTPLAEKWSVRVRNTVASPEHQAVFEGSKPDSTAASRWTTTAGGELLAAGVGTGILGFRADVACLDDVVSGWEEAQSDTQLRKIHNWFNTDLKSRLKPNAKIIQVCQRMSANDLAGYMIHRHRENPTRRLKVIKLKMVAEDGDLLGRAPGERLWPEWFSQEMIEDLKQDDFIWRTMYQQEPPSDTGSWVREDDFHYRDPVEHSSRYGMTDLALSVQTGDYTVHVLVGVDSNGNWDVLHAERDRCAPDLSVKRVLTLNKDFSAVEWLIDDDNASKVFGLFLGSVAAEQKARLNWKPLKMRGQDKETRAAALRGQFRRGKVFFPKNNPPWLRWLKEELINFPNATGVGVDDGVDALGLIGRRLGSLVVPSREPEKVRYPTMQEMTLDGLWESNPTRVRRNHRI